MIRALSSRRSRRNSLLEEEAGFEIKSKSNDGLQTSAQWIAEEF